MKQLMIRTRLMLCEGIEVCSSTHGNQLTLSHHSGLKVLLERELAIPQTVQGVELAASENPELGELDAKRS